MSGSADPAIGVTYYPDDVFDSRKKYQPKRRPSTRSDLSLSRRQSRESFQSAAETKPQPRRRSYSQRRRSYSRSRSRSPSPRRTPPSPRNDFDPEKPWFKKKTFWATVASIASVASVVAVSMSTQATKESAKATRKSAKATMYAADAAHRSADASTRIANGNDLSTAAVVNTAVANGHQDHRGRYLGPSPPTRVDSPRVGQLPWDKPQDYRRSSKNGSQHSRHSNGHHHHRPFGPGLLEYEPAARV